MATRKSRMNRQSLVKKAMEDKEAEQHLALLFVRDVVQRSMGAMEDALDEQAKLAYQEAQNGYAVQGIGKLVQVNRPARIGRNPATGEQIQIPAKTAVKFRVTKVCKDSVL